MKRLTPRRAYFLKKGRISYISGSHESPIWRLPTISQALRAAAKHWRPNEPSGNVLCACQGKFPGCSKFKLDVSSVCELLEFTEAGSLMGYGPSSVSEGRQVGVYIGRILKGEKPAELIGRIKSARGNAQLQAHPSDIVIRILSYSSGDIKR